MSCGQEGETIDELYGQCEEVQLGVDENSVEQAGHSVEVQLGVGDCQGGQKGEALWDGGEGGDCGSSSLGLTY